MKNKNWFELLEEAIKKIKEENVVGTSKPPK